MSIKAFLLVFLFYTMMAVVQCKYTKVYPCYEVCHNGGHPPTCCRAHGHRDGHCDPNTHDAWCLD